MNEIRVHSCSFVAKNTFLNLDNPIRVMSKSLGN
jgi:hypothetical protein